MGQLVSRSIPTLINGVSQQPDTMRLSTQAEEQINFHSSVVEGLSDRPPTQHVAKLNLGVGPVVDPYIHFINRDTVERYTVTITDGDLFVHTLSGVPRVVNFPHGKTYLQTVSPKTTIKAITVADYTFILNNTKIPTLDVTVTPSRAKEAIIFVKAGNYGSNYTVFINGVQMAQKVTSTSVVTDIATDVIAEALRAQLAANLGAGWTVTRQGSVVHVVKLVGDFTINVTDSQGGASLIAFKDRTQTFTSLPTIAPSGFQLKIIGSESSEFDDYYVKFVPSTTGGTFGEGTWEETVGFGVQNSINPANMPHILVRESSGDFTFSQASWDDLTVGDAELAPPPSFLGRKISDIFFFKNRLGILADDFEVYSEVGGYFNFWPTTVTTEIDSDPIDYRVPHHSKVPLLKHALPFSEKLLLFSEQTQFVAQGSPTFTKKTIDTDSTTEFACSAVCRPIGMGKNAYFVFNRAETEGAPGDFDGVREYYIDQVSEIKDAVEVTAQVPKYIPAGTFRLIASTTEDILIALTSGAAHKMYVYKFFYVKDEKLQSSWYELNMGDPLVTKVLGGEFIGSTLYVVMQRIDGVYLEKMNYAPGANDPFVNFVTHFDRRITEAQCPSVTYNSGTNTTAWTLPYQLDGDLRAVTREINPGQLINLTYTSGTTVEATGNYVGIKVYLGQTFLRSYTFSKFFYTEQKDGQEVVVTAGRLQLRTGTVRYAGTGTFRVTVIQDHRDPNNYVQFRDPSDSVFTGRVLGAGSNLLGAVALADGEFHFPILSENTKVTITITTDSFLPSHLLGLEWEAMYHARSRRF